MESSTLQPTLQNVSDLQLRSLKAMIFKVLCKMSETTVEKQKTAEIAGKKFSHPLGAFAT